MTSKQNLIVGAVALLLAAGGAAVVAHAHGHFDGPEGHAHAAKDEEVAGGEHHHHAPRGDALATAQLRLDAGRKWQTDAALREGMSGIRSDVEAAIAPIHSDRYTPADYEKLAGGIEERLNGIIAHCKLAPDVDAQLHLVIADVFGGTSAMNAEGNRTAGVVRIIEALDAYGNYFDHPGWTKIAH
jgi:hypothetical protein